MAKSLNFDDQFNCSVCLDLMTDPVTIPCGHSYCKDCIQDYWDKDTGKSSSCPQCRQIFNPRPTLNRNTMLAEMLENLRNIKAHVSLPELPVAELGDIACDFCLGHKAVKSCLECRTSYCETHLQPHFDLPALKNHKLVNAIRMPTCPKHNKLLEVFCQTDQTCVCTLCLLDEHKGHDIVSPAEEREDKEAILEAVKSKFRDKRTDKEEQLKELEKVIAIRVHTAQQSVDETVLAFTSLISLLEQRRDEVIARIHEHERADLDQADRQQEQLELQITTLMEKEDVIEKLVNTQDNIYFLQNYENMPMLSEVQEMQDVGTLCPNGDMSKIISKFKDKMEHICKQEVDKLLEKVTLEQKSKIKIGDQVRVKRSVSTPKHRWGKVTHQSVGVVTALNGDDICVDFKEHTDWKGVISEMEVVSAYDASALSRNPKGVLQDHAQELSTDHIRVGDSVRVKLSVVTPKLEWGGVTHKSVGVVKAITDDTLNVDFPEFTGWKGLVSEMEKIPQMSTGSSISIGDKVRVKASVISPKHGWGEASRESVGVVTGLKGEDVTVRFPEQAGWIGVISEMELVHDDDAGR